MADTNPSNAEAMLINISKAKDETKRNQQINAFIGLPRFADYKLSPSDIPMIELGWKLHHKAKPSFSFNTVYNVYSRYDFTTNQILELLLSLINRRIIAPTETLSYRLGESPLELLQSEFRLCASFYYQVLALDPVPFVKQILPAKLDCFEDMQDAIQGTFARIRELHWEAGTEPKDCWSDNSPFYSLDLLQPLIELILSSKKLAPVKQIKAAKLNNMETAIVIFLLHYRFGDCFIYHKDILLTNISHLCKTLSGNKIAKDSA